MFTIDLLTQAPPSLLAYIDPGAGFLLLQLVIGALVGARLFFRETIRRAFQAIAEGRSSSKTAARDEADEAGSSDK